MQHLQTAITQIGVVKPNTQTRAIYYSDLLPSRVLKHGVMQLIFLKSHCIHIAVIHHYPLPLCVEKNTITPMTMIKRAVRKPRVIKYHILPIALIESDMRIVAGPPVL